MKRYILFALFLISAFCAHAQSQGLSVQTGLIGGFSKDKVLTPSGIHSGWLVNADARLLDGGLYFIIGGQYNNMALVASNKLKLFSDKSLQQACFRGGFGFDIFRFSERFTIRSKAIGSINFIVSSPSDVLGVAEYDKINDSYLGAVTGLGITFKALDIDIEYQYGIINAIYGQKDTKISSVSFMVGVNF